MNVFLPDVLTQPQSGFVVCLRGALTQGNEANVGLSASVHVSTSTSAHGQGTSKTDVTEEQ